MMQNEFKTRFERYARAGTLVFTLLVLYWLIQMAISLYFTLTGGTPAGEAEQSLYNLLFSLLFSAFVVAVMVMVIRLLQSIRKGSSPFTMANVRRLRAIGWMLILFEVLQHVTTRLFWAVASGRARRSFTISAPPPAWWRSSAWPSLRSPLCFNTVWSCSSSPTRLCEVRRCRSFYDWTG